MRFALSSSTRQAVNLSSGSKLQIPRLNPRLVWKKSLARITSFDRQ